MKKLVLKTALVSALVAPTILSAGQGLNLSLNSGAAQTQAKGLNVILNSGDAQTQAMAMVISLMTMKKHKKEINIVLCGAAGDLADKNIEGTPIKRPDGKAPSAKQHLQMLIKNGAKVEVCPLYLPNSGKDKSVLLDGITVAKPPVVAADLLNTNYQNISF